MSSNVDDIFRALIGSYEDPKQIELVNSITEKTKAGKIVWAKTPSSLVANVPGMQMSFVRSAPPMNAALASLGVGSGWEIFSIRSPHGAEIMKAEQPAKWLVAPPPGTTASTPPPRSKLVQAVDALYSIADVKGEGDIDKAISVIKNL
jgi:hypothetical protein